MYGSHNASFVVEHNGTILEVLELERFFNFKNLGYKLWDIPYSQPYVAKLILNYFKEKYGFTEYENCIHQYGDDFLSEIPAKNYIQSLHHVSHANGTFYQSPFEEAIIISFDGGGNDGFFNIFKGNRELGVTLLTQGHNLDLGSQYKEFGHYLSDIKQSNNAALVYAGKLLGLQSYGISREEWISSFKEYYREKKSIQDLSKNIGVTLDPSNKLSGQIAYDIAATSQQAFEEITFEEIENVILENSNLPICLTGGCALNIVFNTKVKERYNKEVFVGPAPSDCGIAVGMLAGLIKPKHSFDVTYLGPEALDKNLLPQLIEHHRGIEKNAIQLADELVSGKIIGVIQGRAEHGPRALGNRSIICNPLISDMKDKLNFKVKHREWYRPFAPIVRLEDVSEYFDWEGESRWMSFCVKVREKYINKIPAVVHVDGTARVQTITREQNPLMYDVLTEFKNLTGIGVLLNTSFNVDGKPILSTYTDAFKVLHETELDAIYADGYYFSK